MADRKNLAEKVFGAEAESAASLDREKLKKYNNLAATMFNTRVLTAKEMAFPAVAEFASRIIGAVGAYRKVFFVSVLKIDMVYVAAITALISIYDMLNNPLMGIAYDKTRTRWGKARPYLLLTPAPYFLSTAILYSGALFLKSDATDDPKKIIFVFLSLFLEETFSTIYGLPRTTMASLMTPNPQDRITMGLITSYAGNYGAELVASLFMPFMDFNRWGITNIPMPVMFAVLGWFGASIATAGNMALSLGCRERIILQPKPAPLTKTLFYILKNKYSLRNYIASLFTTWISGGGYSWDYVSQIEIFGGAFKSMLFYTPHNILHPLSVLLIPKFQKFFKYNNRNAVITLSFWDIICNILQWGVGRFFIDKSWIVGGIFGGFYALSAINNAPAEVFGKEIGREIADYTEYMTGERPDGTQGLLPGLISSTLTPLNALMTIAVFKWSGYKPEIPSAPWSQNSKVIYRKVLFLYTAFGTLTSIIGLIPTFFYDLVGDKREQMYLALNERRALLANEKTVSDEMQAMIEMLEHEDENI